MFFLFTGSEGNMHPDLVTPHIPPWKLELLSRRSALSRTVEPKLNDVIFDPLKKQSDPCSKSLEQNATTKVPPYDSKSSYTYTTWKELKDGAAVVNSNSVNKFQRSLSSEVQTSRNTHPQVVTCATSFNGDGAFKSSNVEPRGNCRFHGGESRHSQEVAFELYKTTCA